MAMPEDFKDVGAERNARQNYTTPQAWPFLVGLALGIGLCITVVVYFLSRQAEEKITEVPESKAGQTSAAPQPSFDFYEILANGEFNISEWDAKEIAPDGDDQGSLEKADDEVNVQILQIGSFRSSEAAEEVKARLALMDINANIQRVVLNGRDNVRYRVRIGPYKDSEKLALLQRQLLENNFDYMLLTLKNHSVEARH